MIIWSRESKFCVILFLNKATLLQLQHRLNVRRFANPDERDPESGGLYAVHRTVHQLGRNIKNIVFVPFNQAPPVVAQCIEIRVAECP